MLLAQKHTDIYPVCTFNESKEKTKIEIILFMTNYRMYWKIENAFYSRIRSIFK